MNKYMKNSIIFITIVLILILFYLYIYINTERETFNNFIIDNGVAVNQVNNTENINTTTENMETDNLKNNNSSENINTTIGYMGSDSLKNNHLIENTNISIPVEKQPTRYPEYVSIIVDENSFTDNTFSIIVTDNNESPYAWGPGYIIQKKTEDNWENLETIKNLSFYDQEIALDENNQYVEIIYYTKFYGQLTSGIYRVVKMKYNEGELHQFYSNEFEIKE